VDPLDLGPPADPIAPLREALRGHYDIIREVGQGAFATVYLAQDHKHERKVALKVLHADPTSETGELRFIREIRLLARLQHPNILPLHDSGHVEALLYYVMPYVAGETLRDRINRERHIDIAAACSITREVADALAYAHGQGVIHRDIKPENILLSAGHPILADFGIARAIDLAGVRQLTQTGMGSPGTPAYMSPEQLMGDRELDGRSDTYSLGCVLFEMLTGTAPFSGKEGFVKRFTEPPPAASARRKDAPRWIDDVIAKALARDPNDRYQNAHELASALVRPMTATGERVVRERIVKELAASGGAVPEVSVPSSTQYRAPIDVKKALAEESRARSRATFWGRLREQFRAHTNLVASSAVAIVLIAALLAGKVSSAVRNMVFRPQLDTARVALVPFSGTASPGARDGVTSALYAALSEWRGLPLASDQDVAEALRSAGAPGSTRAAAGVAAHVGAGRFIWGQVDAGDSSQARAQVYDEATGAVIKSIRFARSADPAAMAQVARQLLMPADRPATADGGDGRTNSYPAWSAYSNAHVALRRGDYAAAESAFAAAANADPDFGPADVWLGQVRAWLSDVDAEQWANDVTRGLQARSGLSDKDHLVALALSNLAQKQFPQACGNYSQMVAADSSDFVGLFGLGQCRALDSLVVPSASSPSRWEFRSRYADAASAYMRAVSVNPAAHPIIPFDQIQQLLPISSTQVRRGKSASGEEFAAFPGLRGDAVIFIPYPLAEFGRLPATQTAPLQAGAISRNLDALLGFATNWTHDAPQSAAAYQALGAVLEARGEIGRGVSGGLSAIDAIDRARRLAVNPKERFAAGASAAWLLFKQGQFEHARILADSILTAPRSTPGEEAASIIGLAALTGKLSRVAELARVTTPYASSAFNVPVPVMDAAAPFFAFAALGVCGDTTRLLERHLDEQITRYVAENQQARIRSSVKTRPLTMLAPCTQGKSTLSIPTPVSRLVSMQQALAKGDMTGLRAQLASLVADTRAQRPGDISLDFAYQYAWIRVAGGDTAGAVAQLDRTLGALPSIGAVSLREPASAAAAGRAMALRAELAASRGEIDDQRKWAQSVADLWATADQPLQPVVARMRILATPPR